MAPPPKVVKALNAMKDMGFASRDVKPVLKELLKVYENNWELIEENTYQVLLDRILELQDSKISGDTNQDGVVCDEPEPESEPKRKRLRKQGDMNNSLLLPSSGDTSVKKQAESSVSPETSVVKRKVELVSPPMKVGGKEPGPAFNHPSNSEAIPSQPSHVENARLKSLHSSSCCERDEPVTPLINRRQTRAATRALQISPAQDISGPTSDMTNRRGKGPIYEVIEKQLKIEPGTEVQPENAVAIAPLMIKEEPDIDGSLRFEVPIAIICPQPPDSNVAENEGHQSPPPTQDDSSLGHKSVSQIPCESSRTTKNANNRNEKASHADASCEKGKTSEVVTVHEPSSSNINVASSDTGEVNISISVNHPNFHMPNLDTVFKMVEDKCLRSYKILQPDFSLNKIMKEMCQCVWEMGSDSDANKQENRVKLIPELELLNRSGMHKAEGFRLVQMNGHCGNQEVHKNKKDESCEKGKKPLVAQDPGNNLVVNQRLVAVGDVRPPHDLNDISKGEERVRISLVNDFSNEKYPSCFYYIPRNMVYQNAYVNFSLARIGDEDCCSDCYGDCLAAIPCACVRETVGDFAYTSDNLVKDAFLDECISMNRDPEKHPHYYCKVCPLERARKDITPSPCKGHLVRKFIKECWSKCGCNKQCGNRVVQRGITCNLQVFFTPEGKGWGVRTLDELPRGSFVCEYVGEVLTNMELYNRTIQSTGNAKHTYPVLLDADWGSEGVLKDEEALCLDATFYGNVARCYDANMVEIPVEVETPDHHYYHLAFFTTRKVEPYEELTWTPLANKLKDSTLGFCEVVDTGRSMLDYGIDFDDQHHPIKAFKCRCGSKFCRDMKRPRRSKAGK